MGTELLEEAVLDDGDPVGVVGGVEPVGDRSHLQVCVPIVCPVLGHYWGAARKIVSLTYMLEMRHLFTGV